MRTEVQRLREAIDEAIQLLDSEVRAPTTLDDGGVTRELHKEVVRRLRLACNETPDDAPGEAA